MIKVKKDKNLLKEIQRQHLDIESLCNGKGLCGKCLVKLSDSIEVNDVERNFLSDYQVSQNIRLACQHPKLEKDVEVQVIQHDFSIEGINSETVDVSYVQEDYCLAIDVGTTTVVFVLIDGETGEIVDETKIINPQRKYGADVLSRIEHTLKNNNKNNHNEIISAIGSYLNSFSEMLKNKKLKIGITGNTTMLHFLCDIDVGSLVKIPYSTPIKKDIVQSISSMFHTDIQGECTVYQPFSAFIGSDVLAGIAYTNLFDFDNSLYLDLGTNGEIALSINQQIYVTSTAAGPAFEGGNLSCGVGSVAGAIDTISCEHENVAYTTIHQKPAIGICGSGYIDAMACLLKGEMEETGYMEKDWIIEQGIKVTQADVRQFQLAKAAIRSGMDLLCSHNNVTYELFNRLIIAGGFGKHVNIENAISIGLISKELKGKVSAIGNASLLGCMMWVTNQKQPFNDNDLSSITLVELASNDTWKELFTERLFFIET